MAASPGVRSTKVRAFDDEAFYKSAVELGVLVALMLLYPNVIIFVTKIKTYALSSKKLLV